MIDGIQVIEVNQGSPEWHAERAGVITASMMVEVLKVAGGLDDRQQAFVDAVLAGQDRKAAAYNAGYKTMPRAANIEKALAGEQVGDWTATAKAYAFRLAVERISGEPLDECVETYWMRRGHELEPAARAEHGMQIGATVEPAGFIKTADGKFGASADGFIGEDGGAEYKSFVDPERIMAVVLDRAIDAYYPQCQAGLWLSGRAWWDFCLYVPALELAGKHLTRYRLPRDEPFIEDMEKRAMEFDALVEQYRAAILDHEDEVDLHADAEPSAAGVFGGAQ